MGSLTIIGMLFDGNRLAPLLEVLRCSTLAFLARSIAVNSLALSTGLQVFYAASAMFWGLYTMKLLEIKRGVKVE